MSTEWSRERNVVGAAVPALVIHPCSKGEFYGTVYRLPGAVAQGLIIDLYYKEATLLLCRQAQSEVDPISWTA